MSERHLSRAFRGGETLTHVKHVFSYEPSAGCSDWQELESFIRKAGHV